MTSLACAVSYRRGTISSEVFFLLLFSPDFTVTNSFLVTVAKGELDWDEMEIVNTQIVGELCGAFFF